MNRHELKANGRPRWMTDKRFAQLGQVPDTKIAESAGVAVSTVRRWRRRLRVRAWCPGQSLMPKPKRRAMKAGPVEVSISHAVYAALDKHVQTTFARTPDAQPGDFKPGTGGYRTGNPSRWKVVFQSMPAAEAWLSQKWEAGTKAEEKALATVRRAVKGAL